MQSMKFNRYSSTFANFRNEVSREDRRCNQQRQSETKTFSQDKILFTICHRSIASEGYVSIDFSCICWKITRHYIVDTVTRPILECRQIVSYTQNVRCPTLYAGYIARLDPNGRYPHVAIDGIFTYTDQGVQEDRWRDEWTWLNRTAKCWDWINTLPEDLPRTELDGKMLRRSRQSVQWYLESR